MSAAASHSLRWRDWPLAVKLAVMMVGVAILPLTIVSIAAEVTTRSDVLADSRARNLQRAETTAALLRRYFDDLIADVQVLAVAPLAVRALENPGDAALLADLRQTLEGTRKAKRHGAMFVLNDFGDVIASTDPAQVGGNRVATPFFLWANAGRARVHEPRYIPGERRVHINASVPVRSRAGRIIGVAVTRVSLSEIDRLVEADAHFGVAGAYGLLWDERGIVLSSPSNTERRFRPLGRLQPSTRDRLIAEQRFGAETASLLDGGIGGDQLVRRSQWRMYDPTTAAHTETDLNGEQVEVVSVPIGRERLTYAIVAPRARVLAAVHADSRRNVLVAAGAAFLALILALAVAGWVSQPLEQVRTAARALAAGDMEHRARLERRDEIGQLAATFDQMADALASKDAELRQYAETLERRVEERTADLRRSEKLKDEFLGVVSHELRTPLNAMLGWAHVLRRGGLDATQAARALEAIERNARAQTQLVEDLLDTSRVISGTLSITPAPTDVAVVVEQAVESFRPLAESRRVTLDYEQPQGIQPIQADAGRLQQVVGNLLSNAVKFTPPEGRVTVSVAQRVTDIEIRVSDTGVGMAHEFLPFVFDRFRQADSTTTRAHGGLGIGLSIARHIVELHGGAIRAESDGENCGSTFVVLLPAVVGALHAPPTAPGIEFA